MNEQQNKDSFSTEFLMARIALLKNDLVGKDSVIAERNSIITENVSTIAGLGSSISELTADLNAARFQNEQLRRMIFGSKRERFESTLEFESTDP